MPGTTEIEVKTSTTQRILGVLGRMLGGATISSAAGAAVGAVGARILEARGFAGCQSGYNVEDAAKMGAVGGAMLGTLGGQFAGAHFVRIKTDPNSKPGFFETARSFLEASICAGLVGEGVISASSMMGLGETAAAFTTGGLITMLPAAVVITHILLPMILNAKSKFGADREEAPDNSRTATV